MRHVVRLVDDLLEVSRIARGKISLDHDYVDLGETIARRDRAGEPAAGAADAPPDRRRRRQGLVIEGDKTRLAQVFANLLTNAAKYTASGGSIAVSAERDGRDAARRGQGHRHRHAPRDAAAWCSICSSRDARVWTASEGGLGLGLSIVKSLVTLHSGTVEAHSDGPGKGSEFVVLLPATAAGDARTRPRPSSSSRGAPPELAGRRVLLVDDNEDAVASLAEALSDLGHAVEVAHDGPRSAGEAARPSPPTSRCWTSACR